MALPCQRCRRKMINSQIGKVVIMSGEGEPLCFDVADYAKEDSDWYQDALRKAKAK
jgi:deoxycytidylate deaminase